MMNAGARVAVPLFGLLVAMAGGACLAAEAYKWIDERGVTNYGERAPHSRTVRPVNTKPGAIIEGSGRYRQSEEGDPRPAPRLAQGPAPGPMPARGMDFDVFIRLHAGMSEGELLLRAGRPDHEGLENFQHDIVKSYYYFPTVANPYTTVVTVRGGRIANLERIKKF